MDFPPSERSCPQPVWRMLSQNLRLAAWDAFQKQRKALEWTGSSICLVECAKPFVLLKQSGLTCSVH